MNNYCAQQVPSTSSVIKTNFAAAGMIALVCATPMLTPTLEEAVAHSWSPTVATDRYVNSANSPTFDHHSNIFTGDFQVPIENFETRIANFYSKLLASQKPLGYDFEQVLNDNIWDLYES